MCFTVRFNCHCVYSILSPSFCGREAPQGRVIKAAARCNTKNAGSCSCKFSLCSSYCCVSIVVVIVVGVAVVVAVGVVVVVA